ncbi:MAG: sensor histidine kinase [Solirubrobacterales bacterium]|nr:sensor histidine kinase [Solirubrobacterales bacterium]
MSEVAYISDEWIGRLVRVLIVFRTLVLLITVLLLPSGKLTPVLVVAVVLAAIASYMPLRYWRRIGASLARHPAYLATEVLLATSILAAAGARSPFFYFTLGTAALAGVIYGRRGLIPFSALLMAAYELVALEGLPNAHRLHDAQSVVFAPLLYPAAIIAGIAAREMIERGIQTESLLRERTEALAAEKERLRVARELHDSLAKTVEGLALSASMLPARCERSPEIAARVARELAEDARHAALEARALMSDLRPNAELRLPLNEAVKRRVESFAERSGIPVQLEAAEEGYPELPTATKHELLRILGEALVNAIRHGDASEIVVSLDTGPRGLRLSVSDNGRGLSNPLDLEQLKAGGHFGVAGMHERARTIGGALAVAPVDGGGTVVSVLLPRLAPAEERSDSGPAEVDGLADAVKPLGSRRLRRLGVRA